MTGSVIINIFDSIPLWVMIAPIGLCSVIALAVAIERLIFFKKIHIDLRKIVETVLEKLKKGDVEDAGFVLSNYYGPVVSMIEKLISNISINKNNSEAIVQDYSKDAIKGVEKYGSVMSTIATISPMIGLLGTVTGMMKSFSSLSKFGPSARDLLAQGITEALITTALGLMVAIPSMIFYNYMVSQVNDYMNEIEFVANRFLDEEK